VEQHPSGSAPASLSYRDAGVDIDAGNALVERIKPLVRSTLRPGVVSGIGGFGALFELPLDRYREPVLVSGTDGGGLPENLPRVLPKGTRAQINPQAWQRPAVFQWLQRTGGIAEPEMLRTFNCGVGMVVAVAREDLDKALETLGSRGETPWIIGGIESVPGADPSVVFEASP